MPSSKTNWMKILRRSVRRWKCHAAQEVNGVSVYLYTVRRLVRWVVGLMAEIILPCTFLNLIYSTQLRFKPRLHIHTFVFRMHRVCFGRQKTVSQSCFDKKLCAFLAGGSTVRYAPSFYHVLPKVSKSPAEAKITDMTPQSEPTGPTAAVTPNTSASAVTVFKNSGKDYCRWQKLNYAFKRTFAKKKILILFCSSSSEEEKAEESLVCWPLCKEEVFLLSPHI